MSRGSNPTSRSILWLCLALGLSCSLLAPASQAAESAPKIPLGSIKQYRVSTVEQQLESFIFNRLRLDGGGQSITLDVLSGHRPAPTQGEVSARLVHHANNSLKVEVTSFPKDSFGQRLTPATLAAILQSKAAATPPETNLEIQEMPEKTTGAAKFRFLGQRALTLRYAFDAGEERIVRGENWVETDEMIHLVAVEAPEAAFPAYYESIRAAFNSSAMVAP